jgi:carnitine-CoA ligase
MTAAALASRPAMTDPWDVGTVSDLLARATRRWPERIALTSVPDAVELTYAELGAAVGRVAGALEAADVAVGDRVAVMMANRSEYAVVWLACAWLGAVMVPINAGYRRHDAGYLVDHAGVRVAVCDPAARTVLAEVQQDVAHLRLVLDVDDLLTSSPRTPTPPVATPETTLNIQYTSGTTGRPKGCVLSHRYWLTMARKNVVEVPGLEPEDVLLTAQPFSYMDPQWNLVSAIAAGARMVLLDRFHPSTFWRDVARHEATFLYCLGVMPRLMLKMDPQPHEREHRMRLVACSGIPVDLHAELERRFGVPWLETYGMTEIGNAAAMTLADHDRFVGSGVIGRATSTRELRVVDEQGAPVPRGEVGQLVVRGVGLMDGYYRDPEATAEAFRHGWFHTGDLARLDAEGNLVFLGRTKDMIRRSGENISAVEVEEAIAAHPAVRMLACVAVPDELRGEEVKAYVVLQADRRDEPGLREHELAEQTARLLAAFKVPRYWSFPDELPLTLSGKIRKRELPAVVDDGATWDLVERRWR